MTYRSLLVHLDTEPACEERTAVALRLAGALDAHLAGVAPTGLVELPIAPESAASLASLASLAWDTLRDHAQQAAERFRERCRAAGLRSYEAVVDEDDAAASLVMHAQCSDLAILGQPDPKARGHREAQERLEQVVLHSARPTLVLPYVGGSGRLPGRRVLAAWDGSRESVRALTDALPLLRRADTVQLVSWRELPAAESPDLPRRLAALQQWLLWQGVGAEGTAETTDIPIADAMLSRAADMDADLIVMGAYGHARWAERWMGGATRGLLAEMTVPVLMSH